MVITIGELISGIEGKNGFPLDQRQEQAIAHGGGPLLVAAGPGTGKTEVLVNRCLKFICCDGVDPKSVMVTTFTKKAARNLEDRLADNFLYIAEKYPAVRGIDPSGLRIGTLHSLCNDILQEYRYTKYQNVRLLDEMETSLLIHSSLANKIGHLKSDILGQFKYIFGTRRYQNRWDWAFALLNLLNRTVDDQLDLVALSEKSGGLNALYEVNRVYDELLADRGACDFSRLLKHFRDFLDTSQGREFIQGTQGYLEVKPPLTHVLVDEYQDTNPLQESIYLRLCDESPHNITVVGDDDQAIYRFRGGTVECMVGFEPTCKTRWRVDPQVMYLADNHRSDIGIVRWCNDYIVSFPQMSKANVRIPNKPVLNSIKGRTGEHPALGLIKASKSGELPGLMAQLVADLKSNGIIADYSQCVLLLQSVKNTKRYAGPFMDALQGRDIPVYNPRSRDYLEQLEVAQCLGAFTRIVDPGLTQVSDLNPSSPVIQKLVKNWAAAYDSIAAGNLELAQYVDKAANAISSKAAGETVVTSLSTILYHILAHQPFKSYQEDAEKDLRLSKITRLFDAFCNQYGRELRIDKETAGELPGWWYGAFYYGFCGYLGRERLNEDEDEDVICPVGHFPIMTVHQSKGLEFDFVFVGNLGGKVRESSSHQLEKDLLPFRAIQPSAVHSVSDLQWQDDIRRHFVAYSRAKSALILMASNGQLKGKSDHTASFGGQGGGWAGQKFKRL